MIVYNKPVMTGRQLPGRIFLVKLKGKSKEHLVAPDEFTEPYKITLCKKRYDADDRQSSRTVTELTGKECAACRQQLDVRLMPLKRGIRKLILH